MVHEGSTRELPPRRTIVVGLVAVAAGTLLVLRSLEIVTGGRIYAPHWVLFVAGLVFLVPGLMYLTFGIRNAVAPRRADSERGEAEFVRASLLLGAFVTTLFAVLATAAAIYSWFPEYAAGFGSSLPWDMATARLGWAVAALILDAIVLFLWGGVLVQLVRHTRSASRPDRRLDQ